MTTVYEFEESLYVNLTNKCPCACVFCIRCKHDSVGNCESLWLEREPSVEEVIEAFEAFEIDKYKEIVFCGYGEPLEKIDVLIEVCKYLRSVTKLPIRLNTNGLADLIHGKDTAGMLEGSIDEVSISLNAPDAEVYERVARPCFGKESFPALLKFASRCKEVIPAVKFSVVDILTEEELEACKQLAAKMEIPLRIRQEIE